MRRTRPTLRESLPISLATFDKVLKPGQEGPAVSPREGAQRQTRRVRAALRMERDLAFAALEDFVNLGDTLEDLRSFRLKWPGYSPVDIVRDGQRIALADELHPLALSFRDLLQDMWQGKVSDGNQYALDTLLGLNRSIFEYGLRDYAANPQTQLVLSEPALRAVEAQGGCEVIGGSEIHSNWVRGEFRFAPVNFFCSAVYRLWQERWRARTCTHCNRCFVAQQAAQRYCSTACCGKAKRKQALEWWNKRGNELRMKRRREKLKELRKRGK
jgi:hypothetical protein